MDQLTLKSLPELLDGRNFFIPAYQRGYRWTEKQMSDLLDDLYEFAVRPKNSDPQKTKGEFYCLQPIIVQKVTNPEKMKLMRYHPEADNHASADETSDRQENVSAITEDNTWEVIDGQQRLTSLYLLYSYLISKNTLPSGDLDATGLKLFKLFYESRPETRDFLEKLPLNCEKAKENIDFHFIVKAWDAIEEWLTTRAPSIATRYHESPNPGEIRGKLVNLLLSSSVNEPRRSARFIWYELESSSDKNPVDEFLNINNGKIPLTEAELIRGLFLQKRNFALDKTGEQMKIAMQWEEMENTLHHDDFWNFLSVSSDTDNRIELLFRLHYFQENNVKELEEGALFTYYYDKLQENPGAEFNAAVQEIWEKITAIFRVLQDWYEDPFIYNYIGFLVHAGAPLEKIFKLHTQIGAEEPKEAFIKKLKELIRSMLFKHEKIMEGDLDLAYDKNRSKIRELLLFINIFHLNKQLETRRVERKSYVTLFHKFPFDLYVDQSWDVEHIDSVTPKSLANVKDEAKEEYLRQRIRALYGDVGTDFEQKLAEKDYEEIWEKIVQEKHPQAKDDAEKNRLGNLTLLDSSTNRSYGNDFFVMKRKKINEVMAEGSFVPYCTQLVFNKSFRNQDIDLSCWSEDDSKLYEEFILNELRDFYGIKEAGHGN